MKVYTRVVIDIDTLETVEEKSFEYSGPVALCGGGGDGGDGGGGGDAGADGPGFGGGDTAGGGASAGFGGAGNPGSMGGGNTAGSGAGGFGGGPGGSVGGAGGGASAGGSSGGGADAASMGMTGYGGFGGLGIGNPGSYGGQQSVGAPGFSGGYSDAGGVSGYGAGDYGREALGAIYNGLRTVTAIPSMLGQVMSGGLLGVPGAVQSGMAGLEAGEDFAGNLAAIGAMAGTGTGFSGLGAMGSGAGGGMGGRPSDGGGTGQESVTQSPAFQQLQQENPQLAAQVAAYEQSIGGGAGAGAGGGMGGSPYGLLQQMAMGQDPGMTRNLAQIDKYFSDVAANQRRQMGGTYQYGGGLPQKTMETVELNRARAKSGALADDRAQQFSRLMGVSGMGLEKDKLAQAANQFNQQMGLNRDRLAAGEEAADNAYNANLWGSIGNTAGNLLNMYMQSENDPWGNWFSGSDDSGGGGSLTDWRTYAPSGGSTFNLGGDWGGGGSLTDWRTYAPSGGSTFNLGGDWGGGATTAFGL